VASTGQHSSGAMKAGLPSVFRRALSSIELVVRGESSGMPSVGMMLADRLQLEAERLRTPEI
jgi:hypothetical protein